MLPIHVVRELAALLPIWGMKRVPDRVRDERGASFLQGPRVAAELEAAGVRSAQAASVLVDLGFTEVYNVQGGMYAAAGLKGLIK